MEMKCTKCGQKYDSNDRDGNEIEYHRTICGCQEAQTHSKEVSEAYEVYIEAEKADQITLKECPTCHTPVSWATGHQQFTCQCWRETEGPRH